MTCKHCGNPIPENKLICPCVAMRNYDNEQETLSILRFGVHEGWLYLTDATKHLLPTRGYGLTLCRKYRFKRTKTADISLGHLPEMEKDARFCQECIAKVRAVLGQP